MKHTIVPERLRPTFIPNLLANNLKALLNFENLIYQFMNKFTEEYNGGYWEFVTFENGAKAMILNYEKVVPCNHEENYFSGEMSFRSLSLACNLMVCSHMSFMTFGQTQENLGNNYHLLRDVSFEHEWFKAEAGQIWALLD
jgi:hypothetical protein